MLTKTLEKIRQDGRKEERNQEKLFIVQQLHRNGMDLAKQ